MTGPDRDGTGVHPLRPEDYGTDLEQAVAPAVEDGTALDPAWVTRRFQALTEQAGLPRIRLHDLRHTHATIALRAGVHPKVVSDRLGHASVTMTLDTYSHAVPALEEAAAEQIAALIHDFG